MSVPAQQLPLKHRISGLKKGSVICSFSYQPLIRLLSRYCIFTANTSLFFIMIPLHSPFLLIFGPVLILRSKICMWQVFFPLSVWCFKSTRLFLLFPVACQVSWYEKSNIKEKEPKWIHGITCSELILTLLLCTVCLSSFCLTVYLLIFTVYTFLLHNNPILLLLLPYFCPFPHGAHAVPQPSFVSGGGRMLTSALTVPIIDAHIENSAVSLPKSYCGC